MSRVSGVEDLSVDQCQVKLISNRSESKNNHLQTRPVLTEQYNTIWSEHSPYNPTNNTGFVRPEQLVGRAAPTAVIKMVMWS